MPTVKHDPATGEWKVPTPFIVALLMWIISSGTMGIYYAGSLSTRVSHVEAIVERSKDNGERLARIEQSIADLKDAIQSGRYKATP